MGDLMDLRVFQQAEELGKVVWRSATGWDHFAKRTVGKQVVRAVDSVGANIAEAFGRFHYAEKLQLLYYARGSLFETRFWLRQAYVRNLLGEAAVKEIQAKLAPLPIGLNLFIKSIREQRADNAIHEMTEQYNVQTPIPQSHNLIISASHEPMLFSEEDIVWLTQFNANAS